MAGVEEIVGILHLHHSAGPGPSVLAACAAGLNDGIVHFGICQEIPGGGQVQGMVVGVPAFFQVVDVIGPVLIVRHGIPHIGLVDTVNRRQEKVHILISGFLASGGPEGRKVLVIRHRREGFSRVARRCRTGIVLVRRTVLAALAPCQQQAYRTQDRSNPDHFPFHGSLLKKQGERVPILPVAVLLTVRSSGRLSHSGIQPSPRPASMSPQSRTGRAVQSPCP